MKLSINQSIFTLGVIATSLGTASFAQGSESKGWYFTIGGGSTGISDVTATAGSTSVAVEFDSGASYEAGFGYDFGNDIRTEITWSQSKGDFKKVAGAAVTSGDVVASTIAANIYKDFSSQQSKFTPYISAGIGTTNIDTGNITISGTTYSGSEADSTSYLLKFGSKYKLAEQTEVFLEGKFQSVADFTVNTVKYSDITAFGVHAGLNFRF